MIRPFLLIATMMALVAGGCSRGENPGETSPASPVRPQAAVAPAERGGLTVSLQPAEPNSQEAIFAMVEGGGHQVSCRWDLNGEEIPGVTGRNFPSGLAKKGDLVTVRVEADGREAAASATIGNGPPRVWGIQAGPEVPCRGEDIQVVPSGDDPDGDEVEYTLYWRINGEAVLGEQGSRLPGELLHRGDVVSVRIVPSDPENDGPAFEAGEMVVGNAPPFFTSAPPPVADFTYQYPAQAEDPDGDPLTYSLAESPPGMTLDSRSGLLSWTVAGEGEYPVRLLADDGHGGTATQEFTLRVGGSR